MEEESIPTNILTAIRRKSAKIKHRPTKEEIEKMLEKPGFVEWLIKTFGIKRKIVNTYNLVEQEEKEEAARIAKVLQQDYPSVWARFFGIQEELPIFEFIFVRHGESCANAIQKRAGNTVFQKGTLLHKFYRDPELTEKGVNLSTKRHELLRDTLIQKPGPFDDEMYSIGSSALLRAQETAFHMLAKQTGKPVNVFPHLGEIMLLGPIKIPAKSDDNLPNDEKDQMAYLTAQYRDPIFVKGEDLREAPYNPSLQRFFEWAIKHPEQFPEVNGVRRAILYTHSNLLKSKFPFATCVNPPMKPLPGGKLGNNDFLVTIYNPSKKPFEEKMVFLNKEAVFPKWEYHDTRDILTDVPCGREPRRCKRGHSGTPINVFVTKPCLEGGGTRRKRSSRRRRLSRRLQK